MAVEAGHLNLFPSQILSNREVILSGMEGMNNLYGTTEIGYGLIPAPETMIPMYGSTMKAESGISYAHIPVVSRKRPRQQNDCNLNLNNFNNNRSSFTFFGEDFSEQLQLEKLELDRYITHHMEKVRLEVEERQKIYTRRVISAVGESMMRKLISKDSEIQKLSKLNFALEERLKVLYVENKIWRELAESNEATANTLRSNLEQVLAEVVDDGESCCGSNQMEEKEKVVESNGRDNSRVCRSCGKEEATVLLLPCRHLCLCAFCGSSLHICPICNSIKSWALHVNMSS